MPTVAELLDTPAVRGMGCRLEAGVARGAQVRAVTQVESVELLAAAPSGAFVVLTAGGFTSDTGYRLDMVVRLAGQREVAAVALTLPEDGRFPATAAVIAERARLAIVRLPARADVGALCAALGQELAGGAVAAAARAERALEALAALGVAAEEPEMVLERAAAALGVALSFQDVEGTGPAPPRDDGRLVVPVVVDGAVEGHLRAATSATAEVPLRLAVHLTAEVVGRAIARARSRIQAPVWSRAQLLAELLLAPTQRTAAVADRARSLGLPVDGWQQVVRLEADPAGETGGETGGEGYRAGGAEAGGAERDVAEFELGDQLARLALDTARSSGGGWHLARLEAALLLVRMERAAPGPVGPEAVAEVAARVLRRLGSRFPGVVLYCGVGLAHMGVTGLRASAAEARSAVAAARAAGRVNAVTRFDAVGLRRMLLEWYASDTARESVQELLAPLDRLGPERAATAIGTLRVYLDQRCSLTRAAKELHLHRNAVAYRINRIFALLDVDPDDPDQLLALQIACRARALR